MRILTSKYILYMEFRAVALSNFWPYITQLILNTHSSLDIDTFFLTSYLVKTYAMMHLKIIYTIFRTNNCMPKQLGKMICFFHHHQTTDCYVLRSLHLKNLNHFNNIPSKIFLSGFLIHLPFLTLYLKAIKIFSLFFHIEHTVEFTNPCSRQISYFFFSLSSALITLTLSTREKTFIFTDAIMFNVSHLRHVKSKNQISNFISGQKLLLCDLRMLPQYFIKCD